MNTYNDLRFVKFPISEGREVISLRLKYLYYNINY